jgi:hypothetical protein
MARKKERVSDYFALACLALIGGGGYASDWRPILAGVGGLGLMLCGWLAFRMTVACDVKTKTKTKTGYCTHQVNGLLFGCGDHHWDKVLAWSRYLGTGYLARWLHVYNFPVLRFQVAHQPAPKMVAVIPDGTAAASHVPVESEPVTTGETKQVALFYIAVISCAATVAGTAATIVEIVMSASH